MQSNDGFVEILHADLEKLLGLDPRDDPPLVTRKAVAISDRKQIGTLLSQTPSVEFGHLKRVKHENGRSLVLITSEDDQRTDLVDVDVPAFPPLTSEQAAAWSKKYWPVSRTQNVQVSNSALSDVEVEITTQWIAQARTLAMDGCGGSAIIVDPRTNSQVGTGRTCAKNPLVHASMVAIAQTGEAILKAKASNGAATVLSSDETYLCTDFDVFLSHEPCCMCAMALLHSRVRRVTWEIPDLRRGALGSVVRLHTLPNINHRYRVFKSLIGDDAEEQTNHQSPFGCYNYYDS